MDLSLKMSLKQKSNSCLLSLQVYPEIKDSNQACLPPSSFITCSSDNTIRLWNTESSGVHGSTLHRNILSNVSLPFHTCAPMLTDFDFVFGTWFPQSYSCSFCLAGLSEPRVDFLTQHPLCLQPSCLDCPSCLFSPFPPGSH